jgi:hypothetical protein
MITELVGVSFIRSDQRDDLTAIIAALLRPGAKRRRCCASFNAPPTPGRTGGSHCAAAAPMNLHPLQQKRGAYRELLVGLLDYSLPTLIFPLVGSPARPFRLCRRRVPAAPSFAAKLAVQLCGSSLEAIEPPFALAGPCEVAAILEADAPRAPGRQV